MTVFFSYDLFEKSLTSHFALSKARKFGVPPS